MSQGPLPHRTPGHRSWTAIVLLTACAAAQAYLVPGTANPNLAGRATGHGCCSGDSAPAQSPTEAIGLLLVGGEALQFTVSGQVHFQPGIPADNTPDGNLAGHMTTYGDGISAPTSVRFDALFGVFLTDASPTASSTPPALDFAAGQDFTVLSPGIGQIFFIGDGLTSDAKSGDVSGTRQSFIVPAGATRLFFGTGDGFGWFNNVGSFEVAVDDAQVQPAPAPGTLALAGLGLAAITARRRRTA